MDGGEIADIAKGVGSTLGAIEALRRLLEKSRSRLENPADVGGCQCTFCRDRIGDILSISEQHIDLTIEIADQNRSIIELLADISASIREAATPALRGDRMALFAIDVLSDATGWTEERRAEFDELLGRFEGSPADEGADRAGREER